MASFYFVHIPKTAGTSFRLGLSKIKSVSVYSDYGPDSIETSSFLKASIYSDDKDFWLNWKFLQGESPNSFLYGHMPVTKYLSVVGVNQVLTFIRDPIERIISEYKHFVRHKGYNKSFEEFYTHPSLINRQSKMLSGVPLEAIGFIGITDIYSQSLEIINDKTFLNIEPLEKNLGRKVIDKKYDIEPHVRRKITTLNKRDIAVYRKALSIHHLRTEILHLGYTWVHGLVTVINKNCISGWAWWDDSCSDPVELELIVNDNIILNTFANKYCSSVNKYFVPRDAWVGFNFKLPECLCEKLICRVKSTGQVIYSSL